MKFMIIREVTVDDGKWMYDTRNQPHIVEQSLNSNSFSYQSHQQWLNNVLTDSCKLLLVGEVEGERAGVVRFDINNTVSTVSIYLSHEFLGNGHGTCLLKQATAYMASLFTNVDVIRAEVLKKNQPSMHMFEKCGYQIFFSYEHHVEYRVKVSV